MSDISRVRGDTYPDEVTLTHTTTGLPVDLTGCSLKMTLDSVKDPVDASGNLYQLTGVIVNAAAGTASFAPSETQANQVGVFYYDIQLTDQAGFIRTVATGKYKYVQDITK